MFEPGKSPRIYGIAPGVDFSNALLNGLFERLNGSQPEDITKVRVFVNTQRTERRLRNLLNARTPGFLPRIMAITDIAKMPVPGLKATPVVSPLRRKLELARAVSILLDAEPDLAPRETAFDLANSLASLMDEMQAEGVSPDVFRQIEMTAEHALHWQNSRRFLEILEPYFSDTSAPDKEARQRRAVVAMIAHWQGNPPDHPVIVAGSTGSRGPTELLMKAVARLPQGAVILPGFDFDFPDGLIEEHLTEDHPQSRMIGFVHALGRKATDIPAWSLDAPPNAGRNALVNLALRPAPVTDQWLSEGPNLPSLTAATDGVTLIEARNQRQEALAIALCLRKAAEEGKSATLISPDRRLTRGVTALLDRWRIHPDDSAGRPLPLTPPGIFLGLVGRTLSEQLTTERLLEILKHPLCNAPPEMRGNHLGFVRSLEHEQIRGKSPFPDFDAYAAWAGKPDQPAELLDWVNWLRILAEPLPQGRHDLAFWLSIHCTRAETLCKGPNGDEIRLWAREEGETAARVFADLAAHADASQPLSGVEYLALIRSVLNSEEVVRDNQSSHPDITIWGTIEARVGGADLVVLGGLNDGTWPGLPPPDPWLNRQMRKTTGLLSPERRIGLAAHDFQQAVGARNVVICRATRDADAPTVPSRWITRLTNLLEGLRPEGPTALQSMRNRGQVWLDLADGLEQPSTRIDPAPRPAPCPPVAARPARLSVTGIKTLILDPYEIYARHVLRLHTLDPIRLMPDARLRGQAFHTVLERFVQASLDGGANDADALKAIASQIFEDDVPWPATRRMWNAQVARFAAEFVSTETTRRQQATPLRLEQKGRVPIAATGVDLSGIADRIDRTDEGDLVIYDYKSGTPPKKPEIENFDKQLHLLAHMASAGAFDTPAGQRIAAAAFIGLKSPLSLAEVDVSPEEVRTTWQGLEQLITRFRSADTGFPALYRHLEEPRWGDYLHLSRFGEWSLADESEPMALR